MALLAHSAGALATGSRRQLAAAATFLSARKQRPVTVRMFAGDNDVKAWAIRWMLATLALW